MISRPRGHLKTITINKRRLRTRGLLRARFARTLLLGQRCQLTGRDSKLTRARMSLVKSVSTSARRIDRFRRQTCPLEISKRRKRKGSHAARALHLLHRVRRRHFSSRFHAERHDALFLQVTSRSHNRCSAKNQESRNYRGLRPVIKRLAMSFLVSRTNRLSLPSRAAIELSVFLKNDRATDGN